jgi:class 3 adenylate cyclase
VSWVIRNGIATAQVISCDIVNYSCRRSSVQRRLVIKFQQDIRSSLTEMGKSHEYYACNNEVDLNSEIITLATGDGIVVVFTLPGPHDLAMEFSLELLRRIHAYNSDHQCEKFLRDCWCDCHCSYYVRIGQADGRCVFYRDINGMVNVAGNAVNAAYRVMGKADPSQILVTKRSYEKLVNQPAEH